MGALDYLDREELLSDIDESLPGLVADLAATLDRSGSEEGEEAGSHYGDVPGGEYDGRYEEDGE